MTYDEALDKYVKDRTSTPPEPQNYEYAERAYQQCGFYPVWNQLTQDDKDKLAKAEQMAMAWVEATIFIKKRVK